MKSLQSTWNMPNNNTGNFCLEEYLSLWRQPYGSRGVKCTTLFCTIITIIKEKSRIKGTLKNGQPSDGGYKNHYHYWLRMLKQYWWCGMKNATTKGKTVNVKVRDIYRHGSPVHKQQRMQKWNKESWQLFVVNRNIASGGGSSLLWGQRKAVV